MDEVPKQLLSDIRNPIPAQPGQPERFDYEYQSEGIANSFMFDEQTLNREVQDWVNARNTKVVQIDWRFYS